MWNDEDNNPYGTSFERRDSTASYSAANLKLLNTIALQTAAAIANSILCAEMVDAARARAAFAAP